MSPSTTNRAALLAAALILSACRFGGPSGDPTIPVVDGAGGFPESGGQAGRGGNGGQAGQGASGGTTGAVGGTNPGGSAGSTADASDDVAYDVSEDATPDATSDGDAWPFDARADVHADMSDGDPVDSGPPTACLPPFASAVCDPVCNTGCTPLLRCDITETPRTGVCVGTLLSTTTEGMACTRTLATDDCVERLSCINRICRRLCYRDTDCTTNGTCCNMAIDVDGGTTGYRACGACAP